MKNLKLSLSVILTFKTFFAFAQTFQGYFDAQANKNNGFSYNITISVTELEYNRTLQTQSYRIKLISIDPDSKGYYDNGTARYYSCSELGSICNPYEFSKASVSFSYLCNNEGEKSIVFYTLGEERVESFRLDPNSKCSYSISNFRVNIDAWKYNSRILELNKKSKGESNFNNQNSSNSNRSSSNTTNTNTSGNIVNNNSSSTNTTQNAPIQNNQTYTIPSAESQMRQLGIDPDKDYLGELITMGGTLLQEINENRRLRWEKETKEAERLERLKAENTANNKAKYINYFKKNFVDKYFLAAKSGDEAARLILIMKCKELETECSAQPESNFCDYEDFLKALPQDSIPKDSMPQEFLLFTHWYWFSLWESEMVKNNNIEALMIHGSTIIKQNLEYTLPLLEKAIAMGSLDAMVILGMYYNRKDYNKGDAIDAMDGGMDEAKAIYWFTKAANAGCPMAAYYLGMIYRYGHTQRPKNYNKSISSYIAYSVKKNDLVAADWFAKSIVNSKNHEESSFAKHDLICSRNTWSRTTSSMEDSYYAMTASITNPDAYMQLSEMYLKGIGVSKNSVLAEQLKLEGEALYDFYKNLK